MTIGQNRLGATNGILVDRNRTPVVLMQVAHIVWRILTNITVHRNVAQVLRLRPFAAVVENNPKFAFKYLAKKYLARNLTVTERASCFIHHYTRLYNLISDRALHQILYWDIEFGSIFETTDCLALTMGTSRPFDHEGELSLLLKMDGEIFFTLSFTIVPGWVVKSSATDVLLISRIQGTPGYSPDQIRHATEVMHGVRPRALLLSALEGIAIAFGIHEIASVSTRNHIDYCEELDEVLRNSYDHFFAELGLASNPEGFFRMAVPIEDKPLELIKRGHKIRTRKKRAFRKHVQLACSRGFLKLSAKTKEAVGLNGEITMQEVNAFGVEFIPSRMYVAERTDVPLPASLHVAGRETVGR